MKNEKYNNMDFDNFVDISDVDTIELPGITPFGRIYESQSESKKEKFVELSQKSEINNNGSEVVFNYDALYAIARDYTTDEGTREMSGYITTLIRKIIAEWDRGISTAPLTVDTNYVYSRLRKKQTQPQKKTIGFCN